MKNRNEIYKNIRLMDHSMDISQENLNQDVWNLEQNMGNLDQNVGNMAKEYRPLICIKILETSIIMGRY